jgi:hypothetical protein
VVVVVSGLVEVVVVGNVEGGGAGVVVVETGADEQAAPIAKTAGNVRKRRIMSRSW